MLLMLQQWNSHQLEVAMLLDEPPFHGYQPMLAGGEAWRAEGHLAAAARHIDLHGYAWFFVVYKSDPLTTWGQRRVRLTTGGEILREQSHCGLCTGVFTSLRYEVLARQVYGNIVGDDSHAECDVIIDARIQHDPPDSGTVSRPPTTPDQLSQAHSASRQFEMHESAHGTTYTTSASASRNRVRSRGGKTILSCGSNSQLLSSSAFMNDSRDRRFSGEATSHEARAHVHVNNAQNVAEQSLAQPEQPRFHEALGHSEPQYRSRRDLYGEIPLVPKPHHGAVVSFLTKGAGREDWYVEDGYKYSEKFQFLLTEFQRRPFVSKLLSRLGFVAGAAPNLKEALQPHVVNVFQSFEDMSKVTKHGRFR